MENSTCRESLFNRLNVLMGKKSTSGDKHQRAAQRAINGLKAFGESTYLNKGNGKIRSLGTARQYKQIYKRVSEYLDNEKANLRTISIEQAERYLDKRSHEIQDKQLANERQALKIHLWNIKQDKSLDLKRFKSSRVTPYIKPRAYSLDQVKEIIKNCPTERDRIAVAISYSAGLRAHELHRIARVDERPVVHRAADFSNERFAGGRETWPTYTVIGKGGGEREIKISPTLAERLEDLRLTEIRIIRDRGRLRELKADGRNDENAKKIVTQELGHWSTTNLAYYLR